MNPAIIMAALQAGGDLVGAISKESGRKKKKRKYIQGERDNLNYEISRDFAQQMGMPTYDLDAKHRMKQVREHADEAFAFDPMTFVPFAGHAAQAAQGIYDEANKPSTMDFGSVADEEAEDERRARDFARQMNPWAAYARGY